MVLAYHLQESLVGTIPGLRAATEIWMFVLALYIALPVWVALLTWQRLDRILEAPLSALRLTAELARVHAFGGALVLAVLWLAQIVLNRSVFGLFISISFLLMWGQRLLLLRWARVQFSSGVGRDRVLFVGQLKVALNVRAHLAGSPWPPDFVGVLTAEAKADETGADSILGKPTVLQAVLHDHAVDHVIFVAPFESLSATEEFIAICEEQGVAAEFALHRDEREFRRPRIAHFHGEPLLTYDSPPKRPESLALKQIGDTVGSGLLLLISAPLLFMVAVAILLTMGRPILFIQERIGRRGRRFSMLKFRTMVVDAEQQKGELEHLNEAGGPVFKSATDPRVTRLGNFLRRSSIDELPQLINVLNGSMSIIGPRPLPVAEQQNIRGHHRRRLALKPGSTGLWQVSGRSNITFEAWMELDLRYVEEGALGLDLKILLLTIPAVLFGRGAR